MILPLILLLSSILLPNLTQASDFISARTAGLAGAGHAGPILNDPIYLNPAYASFLPTYSISASYLIHRSISGVKGRNYNVSVMDGRTDMFQAGLGYTERDDARMIHFFGSKKLFNRFAVGLGGKVFLLPDGQGNPLKEGNFSIGYIPFKSVQLGFIADNILEGAWKEPTLDHNLYREFILGSKFNIMEMLMIYLDPHVVPSLPGSERWGHELGAEITMFKDFFIRGGIFRNAMVPFQGERGEGYGLGISWVGPRFSMDYGFYKVNQSISPILTSSLAHNFGLTLYF